MADTAAARREARRRRILENSHNRLQLISGKSTEDCSKGSPIRTITEQDSHKFCATNGLIVTEQETLETFPSLPLLSSLTSEVPVSDSEVVNDLAFSAPRSQEAAQTSFLDTILIYKYDIVILSVIIQILNSLVLVTDTSYIFLPVIIYSVTKMLYFPGKSHSDIGNALILLNNLSSSSVQRIIQVMQTVTFVISEVCIFLFATICIQSVFYYLKDSMVT